MEQVLPFKKVAYDYSVTQTGDVSNMSAEEYISWVRDQAESLPDVTRVDIDLSTFSTNRTNYIPVVDDACLCSEKLLPSEEWENDCVKDFSDLRLYMTSLAEQDMTRERKVVVPQLKDKNAWNKFCFGIEYVDSAISISCAIKKNDMADDVQLTKKKQELTQVLDELSDCDDDDDDGFNEANAINEAISSTLWHGLANVPPSFGLMLQIDHVMTQRVFKYHVEWLESTENNLTSYRTFWIYALLARIEKPLHKDTVFLIRKLYKICSKLRSVITDEADGSLPDLNLLITITGIYFGQRNLS